MAIGYKWTINQMNAHIESEGEQNVIFTVHWTYSASEEIEGKSYYASSIGAQGFTYVKGEPFIPYDNSEEFENVVIGWLEGALDIVAMRTSLEAQIQKQVTPVNEDLYFTWQSWTPPVPPVEE
tara:strand:+ start:219 stop:587 length:369 start_codon:yes stop_codon:yes gene_type:complete